MGRKKVTEEVVFRAREQVLEGENVFGVHEWSGWLVQEGGHRGHIKK